MSDFFEDFDFSNAGAQIRSLGASRGASDIFAEAINAFYFRLKSTEVRFSELKGCLGAPDRMGAEGDLSFAEYDWEQFVSGNLIRASTRFLISDDSVVRVLPSPA
jgi:hypothetical protein